MYTTPRKVKQESRLRRSLSLTNNNNNINNANNRINQNGTVNGSDINGDELPAPSLTSPYYTLSNRVSHQQQQYHHLNGIAEQPVSASVPLSASSSSLPDPFTSLSHHPNPNKGIPIDSQNGNQRFSYAGSNGVIIIPDVIDVSQQPDGSTLHYQSVIYSGGGGSSSVIPPPYRNPPRTLNPVSSNGHTTIVLDSSAPISPQSVPDSPVDAFHTHSAKFPIVKEVIISEREVRNGPPPPQQQHPLGIALSSSAQQFNSNNNNSSATGQQEALSQRRTTSAGTLPRLPSTSSTETTSLSSGIPPTPEPQSTALLTPEYIKKFQHKKLTKHLPWRDEKRALTLDSETAKELQNQLAQQQHKSGVSQDTSTIRRSGSAFELERLIEAFNQEQHALVMSSLQQGLVPKRRLDGIDNPALDIGGHYSSSNNPSGNLNGHIQNGLHNGNSSAPSNQSPYQQGNNNNNSSSGNSSGPGGKMAGYSFDSSASQSLSLSSSNADSLDTVIYKGPNAGTPSVRDWQRSKEAMQSDFGHHRDSYRSDSQGIFDSRSYPMQQASSSSTGSYQPMQFNGPGSGGGGLSGQTPSSSSMANNGYSVEYRHQQQQLQQQQQQQQQHLQQQQQNLSVQSVHQSQHLHQQQNGGVGGGVNMMMRQANGTSSVCGGGGMVSSPMLPTKSPMVTHKPMLPPPGQSPSNNSSNQSVPSGGGGVVVGNGVQSSKPSNLNGDSATSGSVGLDKAKDSTKMFPTKTYNHIKDMISSRFGNGNSSSSSSNATNGNNNPATGLASQKGLNNSNVVNSNNNANNAMNSAGSSNNANGGFSTMANGGGQNGGGSSYMDNNSMGIPPALPTYGMNQHGQFHSHSIHDTFGGGANGPGAPPYYTGPPAISPPNGNQQGSQQQQNAQAMLNGGSNANSYRSPPMNDRKNVNTSFRKAIHQSTLKSNLTEESLQLRPIMETGSNLNGNSNRDMYRGNGIPQYSQQQNGEQQQQQQRYGLGHEPPSPSLIPQHVERAQRALDKLCETGGVIGGGGGGGGPFTRTGSGTMSHPHHQNGITRMVQQFSSSNNNTGNNHEEHGINPNSNRPMYPLNGKIGGAMSSSAGGVVASPSQLSGAGGELGAIPRNRFSVTPGPSSSTSNSSGGLGAGGMITVESSLSSPSSASYNNTHGMSVSSSGKPSSLLHQTPTVSLANGSGNNNNNAKTGTSANNNKSANNNDPPPPPLPTSQKPEVSGVSGHSSNATGLSHHLYHGSQQASANSHHNSLGLPPVLPSVLAGEKRENGDGSSGTMETPSSGNIHESAAAASPQGSQQQQGVTTGGPSSNASSSALSLNKSKSEQLKKITADLHNLAISVAAEQQFHHNSHHNLQHHLQFAPGSGSSAGVGGSGIGNNSSSSECENKGSQRIGSGQSHTTSDSGVGTVMLTKSPLNSISDQEGSSSKLGSGSGDLLGGRDDHNVMDSVSSGNDSEWVDIVEPEIRQILELEKKSKPGKSSRVGGEKMMGAAGASGLATSTPAHITQERHQLKGAHLGGHSGANGKAGGEQSDLMGDITASPIPHHRLMSGSPVQSPKVPKKFDLNAYNKKASQNRSQELLAGPSTSNGGQNGSGPSNSKVAKSPRTGTKVNRSNSGAGQRYGRASRGDKGVKNIAASRLIKDLGLKGIKLSRHAASQILYPHDDNGDITSTTTGLDLESMLDGQTEQTSDDDDDMSTTIDTTDAHAIRRQLESLESMYTEVLKVLGAKRFAGGRYPPSDLRNAKRRPYGSMSSLPSSVSSRPFRERKLKLDDKKKVKDIKSINKRFQRLESHVVTLARSVAHLSSEMRTQHLMVQEIESIRNEMQQLRNQVVKSTMQNQSAAATAAAAQNFARMASGRNGAGVNFVSQTDWTSFRNALPSLTNPCRVRKLTKFFGDEPPLVRIFLKKLGYEKYASAFEQERIGIMELPYLTEERLNKMGIPMGPRLRILQEAQLCLKPGYHQQHHDSHHQHHQTTNHGPGNLSVYVV